MRIGIYGGTFNPPHQGHMLAARIALEALDLDRLILIPTAQPPHKDLPAGSPTAEDRLAMTNIAADNLLWPAISVSDLELRRAGRSYTADTIEALHRQYPDDELWFLMGADMFLSLQNWHGPERIMACAGIAGFARAADQEEELERQAELLRQKYQARVKVLRLHDTAEISSTQLREMLLQDKGWEYLVPAVRGYILMHGLYGTHADLRHLDLEDLRACSYSMVKAKRLAHIRGTEEEAVRLARRWGGDEELARKAGILHDCTKYLNLEEQLQLCEKYGIVLDELEQKAVKLLHAKTGAAIARHVFGMPEAICSAIFWHTTGKADMSLLEKILYMADYVEPNRRFDEVEELRRLAYSDLDAAVLRGCELSIVDMEERGQPVHRNTLEARDWLREH